MQKGKAKELRDYKEGEEKSKEKRKRGRRSRSNLLGSLSAGNERSHKVAYVELSPNSPSLSLPLPLILCSGKNQ